jgi:mannose-6-phosphate isomerase-like protein (cupin superfamily)
MKKELTMPVFGQGPGNAPAWCELEAFDIIPLLPGESIELSRRAGKEKLIVCEGQCTLEAGDRVMTASRGTNVDLAPGEGSFILRDVAERLTAVWMSGRWGDEVGGSGLFSVDANAQPPDDDTPYDYRKTTSFDNHFHDCDEYWIVYQGRGVVYSEGRRYEVGPGDCVATGTGFHHDLPEVLEGPVKAVYFETTMERAKRPGHLHEPQDGTAVPAEERM